MYPTFPRQQVRLLRMIEQNTYGVARGILPRNEALGTRILVVLLPMPASPPRAGLGDVNRDPPAAIRQRARLPSPSGGEAEAHDEALRLRPECLKAQCGSAIPFENRGGLARAEDRCKEALGILLPRLYG